MRRDSTCEGLMWINVNICCFVIFLRLLDEFVEAVGSGREGGKRDPFIGSYHQLEGQLHIGGRVRRRNETEHRVTNARLINPFGEKMGK